MSRYDNTSLFGRDLLYFGTTKYPSPPLSSSDIYVITQANDRYDQLAQKHYGDSSLWWIISTANPNLKQNSYFPPVGIQIRIPQNIAAILNSFKQLNER